ncbi:MAG: FHA domain-containing protein [Nitriliruptorales bacterium]|nr:FHA domain-containing protein [Nitriliruptorales bacterium]
MAPYLDVRKAAGSELFALETDQMTLGSDAANDITVSDRKVSRVHAVLQRYSVGWFLRDLDSTNGTYIKGVRLSSVHQLRHGDEIRVGDTTVVYRDPATISDPHRTLVTEPPPELTRREREVLIVLCRPLLSGGPFVEPASVRQMAKQLHVTEAAIKDHLGNLYRKFEIEGTGERRRLRLANEVLERGALTVAELRDGDAGTAT